VIAAVVVLGLVCLALIALVVYREHEHAAQLSSFADRIQAPEIARGSALTAAFATEARTDTDAENDAKYGYPLSPDPDLIPFGAS
jgi:hypothetical protein